MPRTSSVSGPWGTTPHVEEPGDDVHVGVVCDCDAQHADELDSRAGPKATITRRMSNSVEQAIEAVDVAEHGAGRLPSTQSRNPTGTTPYSG